tara:strand:+ start:1047 stop:2558 length:1512 start_codon:yes stop_codon:yes gene_type:complete
MEYTYEEVMTALRNADAAGDTEAATRLAEMASSMMSQPEESKPTKQPEESSILGEIGRQVGLTARGAITGLTAIPGMIADAPVTIANQFGANLPLPSEAQQQLMTRAGLPEPQNQMERAVQAGVGAMTGVGAEAALAKSIGTQALAPLTQQLGSQTAAAGIAAPVATVVSENVGQQTESPVASIVAGIAAGVMTGGATAKAIKMGQPVPTPITIQDVRNKSSEGFNAVSKAGITVKPLSALGIISKMRKDLDEFNFNPELDNHKPIATLLKQYERQIGQQRVKFVTLEQMRRAANQMKTSNDPVTKLLAGSLVNSMDTALSRIKPTDVITGGQDVKGALKTLVEARANWKVSSRAQILEDVLDVSAIKALDPKASESELIRRGLINLAANKKRMSLFNSDEQKAIKQTANSGVKDTLLSFVARFNPQRNQIVAGGTVGAAFVDPLSAGLVSGSGFAADKMQQAMRSKQTKELITGMLSGNLKAPDVNSAGYRSLVEAVKASTQ